VMANWFPMDLKDAPRIWLMNLPHESITSWKDLCRQFVANFMPTYERPATKNNRCISTRGKCFASTSSASAR
jgi:hypothetical protein